MTEEDTSPEQRYVEAVFSLDPADASLEIIGRRRAHLSLPYPPAFPPGYVHLPQRLECQAGIEALRESLASLSADEVLARAMELRERCAPDQDAWLQRVVHYAQQREALASLAGSIDAKLLEVLPAVFTAQSGEAAGIKETYLEQLWQDPDKGMRNQVALLRRRVPALAALEGPWLDRVAQRSGPSFGRQHLAWVLLVLVYVILVVVRNLP